MFFLRSCIVGNFGDSPSGNKSTRQNYLASIFLMYDETDSVSQGDFVGGYPQQKMLSNHVKHHIVDRHLSIVIV